MTLRSGIVLFVRSPRKRFRIAVVIGTRPEAVKLAPVILRLLKTRGSKPIVLCTGQHGELAASVLDAFGIRDYDRLKLKRANGTLWDLSAPLISQLGQWFDEHPVDAVLVQGDTTSAFLAALAAYYHRIPVGHVEAGLRTGNRYSPFPEELNRRLLSTLATWHFAPTKAAAAQLRRDGIDSEKIFLTGNTVVDAMRSMMPPLSRASKSGRSILVTCHRRENLGAPMRAVLEALRIIARRNPDVKIAFPVHPNPDIRRAVAPVLAGISNVTLCGPMPYREFLGAMAAAHLVLSDSGGVQEEATALGKPVLVLRNETERQEGIENGPLKLVGADSRRIVRETERLLRDDKVYRKMCRASDVFGDGKAAVRVVNILIRELGRAG